MPRPKRLFKFRGDELCLPEIIEKYKFKVKAGIVRKRLEAGWELEKALTTPPRWSKKEKMEQLWEEQRKARDAH